MGGGNEPITIYAYKGARTGSQSRNWHYYCKFDVPSNGTVVILERDAYEGYGTMTYSLNKDYVTVKSGDIELNQELSVSEGLLDIDVYYNNTRAIPTTEWWKNKCIKILFTPA